MKPVSHLLSLYVGFVAGTLQTLAFPNKWDGLGVLILITIILIIACMMHASEKKPKGAIRKNLKNRVVRNRKKIVVQAGR